MHAPLDSDVIPFSFEPQTSLPKDTLGFGAISCLDFRSLSSEQLQALKDAGLHYSIWKANVTLRSGEQWTDVCLYAQEQGGGLKYKAEFGEGTIKNGDSIVSITIRIRDHDPIGN